MDAHEFLKKNSKELSKKYPGKYIAVVGEKLAAVNESAYKVFKKAKEKFPDKEVAIFYMPTDEEVVTLL